MKQNGEIVMATAVVTFLGHFFGNIDSMTGTPNKSDAVAKKESNAPASKSE